MSEKEPVDNRMVQRSWLVPGYQTNWYTAVGVQQNGRHSTLRDRNCGDFTDQTSEWFYYSGFVFIEYDIYMTLYNQIMGQQLGIEYLMQNAVLIYIFIYTCLSKNNIDFKRLNQTSL